MEQSLNAFLHVLHGRTALRRYADKPVDEALLAQLLDAALSAPTAANKQAWAFVAVRDPGNVRRLCAFAPGIIGLPPVVVAACFDHSKAVRDTQAPYDTGMLCLAMAVQNLLLAAHAAGIGGCPVSSFRRAPVGLLLRLPRHLEPLLLVPLGHPAGPPGRQTARNRDEVISYETWNAHGDTADSTASGTARSAADSTAPAG